MSDLGRVASKASKTSGINAARRCGACSMRLLDIVTARRRAHGKRTRCTTSFFNASSSERRSLNVPRRSMGAVGTARFREARTDIGDGGVVRPHV